MPSNELGEGLCGEKRLCPSPQGTPSRERGAQGTPPTPHSPCPHYLVSDHHPLSPGLVSADKESAAHILSREGGGNLLGIVVGGVQESLDARPGAYKLVLRNRKGFIRLALTHGYQGEGS